MSIEFFIVVLVIHWIADFIFQSNWEAINKSSRWDALLSHTTTYALFWFLVIAFYGAITNANPSILWFIPITFVIHTITDYYTSRWVKKLREKEDFHNMFVVIGLDQILHYVQIFYTFKLLNFNIL